MTTLKEHTANLSISLSPIGEAVINFPDGLHLATNQYPSEEDLADARKFIANSFGRTMIMQLRTREIYDGLTNLLLQYPARAMIQKNLELLMNKRFEGLVSVLLLDLDHFGQVNKQYGQNAGDQVLRWFAEILGQSVRVGDVVARWGGEEFLVFAAANKPTDDKTQRDRDRPFSETATSARVSTGTTMMNLEQIMANGKLIGDRIRTATANRHCHIGNTAITQTVTVGVANAYIQADTDVGSLFETLLKEADEVMYRGKRNDERNKVHVAPLIVGKPRPL